MGGGPSGVFAAGLGAAQSWNGAKAWGPWGALAVVPAQLHLWTLLPRWLGASAQRAGVAPGRAGHPGIMPVTGGGAGTDVSHRLLGLLGRIGVGGGRTGSRDKKHSGGRRWMLSGLAASSPLFLRHPLLLISTRFFFKEGGGRGRNPGSLVDQTFHVLLASPKSRLVLLT